MSHGLPEALGALELATLTSVLRQAQGSPNLEILEWPFEPLSDKGIINPGGLFLFKGKGARPTRDTAVVGGR